MFGRQLHASWVFIVLKCSYLTTSTTLSITEVGFVTSPLTLKQARRTSAGAFGLKSNSSDRNNGDRGQQGRVPWDVLRFVQQSSRFVRLPNPLQFLGDNQKRVIYPGDVIWEPGSSSNNFFKFSPLDDVVMGGASKSFIDNETGIWRGTVTTANNGGFVGIRSTPFDHQPTSLDMTRCTGLTIKVKNGKTAKMDRFKAVVRDSTALNGVSWTTSFDTSSTTPCTVKIPFGKQRPSIFARTVPNVVFKKGNVVGFQFTYSKFEYDGDLNPNFSLGELSLQIMGIYAY